MKLNIKIFLACLFTSTILNAQNFEWVNTFGGINSDYGNSVHVDVSGNIYVTGSFRGTVDFDPGEDVLNLTSVGGSADIFILKMDASQNILWARSFGDFSSGDSGNSISVDVFGNVYVLGNFQGTVDFDSGESMTNITSMGESDVFVLKLDSSGGFVWAKSFGGNDFDSGNKLCIDNLGNIYATGYFKGLVDFDPGVGTENFLSAGDNDIFILKLDNLGNFIWVKTFGGIDSDRANGIETDSFGNVYATGSFFQTVDFDPGQGITNLTSAGYGDIFVLKLDFNGNFVWVKSFTGVFNDAGYSISVDASDNLYTTGVFSLTVDFDPGEGTANLISSGSDDIFVQKMDSSGNFIWAKRFGGNSVDGASSISIDSSGNVYTSGYFIGTVDFDPGEGVTSITSEGFVGIFVQKMDSSGNFIWVKTFGGVGTGTILSSSIDEQGNLYTTGYFAETVDFNPGTETFNITSVGNNDAFVHKMSQNDLSIVEIGDGLKVNVYPNPSDGLVQISFAKPVGNVSVTVADAYGKLIYEKKLDIVTNTQLDIIGEAGIYFLNIKTPSGQSVIKLIKK